MRYKKAEVITPATASECAIELKLLERKCSFKAAGKVWEFPGTNEHMTWGIMSLRHELGACGIVQSSEVTLEVT